MQQNFSNSSLPWVDYKVLKLPRVSVLHFLHFENKIILFICKAALQGEEGETQIFNPSIHSLSCHNCWSWEGLELGARSFF